MERIKPKGRRNYPDVFALVVIAGAASGNFIFGVDSLLGAMGAVVGALAGVFVVCRVLFRNGGS